MTTTTAALRRCSWCRPRDDDGRVRWSSSSASSSSGMVYHAIRRLSSWSDGFGVGDVSLVVVVRRDCKLAVSTATCRRQGLTCQGWRLRGWRRDKWLESACRPLRGPGRRFSSANSPGLRGCWLCGPSGSAAFCSGRASLNLLSRPPATPIMQRGASASSPTKSLHSPVTLSSAHPKIETAVSETARHAVQHHGHPSPQGGHGPNIASL